MTRKIFRSILFAALCMLPASLVIILGGLYSYYRSIQETQLRDELRLAAYGVEGTGRAYLERLTDWDGLPPAVADYRFTWIARDGAVLYDTFADAETLENHRTRPEVREALAQGESTGVRYSSTLMEKTLYYARALSDGTVLRISVIQVTAFALALGMLQPILIVGLIAVVLSALLASWLSRRIIKSLNRMDLDHPLDNDAYEELLPLLQRIHEQHQQTAADRSRREFTANVSHELKTPLQSILGSAELLENGLVRPEDVPQFAGRIHSETARLVALVEDIIRLSQLDEGASMQWEAVDLYELAEEAVSGLRDMAEAKRVQLSLMGEHTVVNGVRGILYDMIRNLCDNAVTYNVEGGSVEISVSTDGQTAIVSVKDTGIGIPAEYQSRVFQRFFRVDKSRSKSSGGTGLGLAIVKHAAQYHHGEITLHSEVGRGTTIMVTIPMLQ